MARHLVGEIVQRASQGGGGGGGGGRQGGGGGMPGGGSPLGGSLSNGSMGGGGGNTIEMLIPGAKCGLVIGKSGETIKSLQVSYAK